MKDEVCQPEERASSSSSRSTTERKGDFRARDEQGIVEEMTREEGTHIARALQFIEEASHVGDLLGSWIWLEG